MHQLGLLGDKFKNHTVLRENVIAETIGLHPISKKKKKSLMNFMIADMHRFML